MGKHRVYEIAKELGTDSKVVLDVLAKHKIEVKNHMSSVDDATRAIIEKALKGKGSSAPSEPKAKPHSEKAKTSATQPPTPKTHEHKATKAEEKPVVKEHVEKPAEKVAPVAKVEKPEVKEEKPVAAKETPAAETKPAAPPAGATKQKIIIKRPTQNQNNSQRPQGQGGQRPYQGQGGQRPQGQGGQRPYQGQGGQRPYQGQGGQRPYQGQGGQRPQGQGGQRPYQGQGGQRPQGQGGQDRNRNKFIVGGGGRPNPGQGPRKPFTNRPQGSNFQRNNKDDDYDNKKNFFKKQEKPKAVPDGPVLEQTHYGKEVGRRGNKKPEKKAVGSYSERGSRPRRTNDFGGRKNKNKNNVGPVQPKPVVQVQRPEFIEVGESIVIADFAKLIKAEPGEVIKKLFLNGEMYTINQSIDHDRAVLMGLEFNVEVRELPPEEDPTEIPEVEDDPAKRLPRPPVVTVMGHVDHGKTSLLDAIRETNVTSREAGGITQHIGAYKVTCNGKPIVFLDTPGHEAFTAMRARGAQVTDVAVLVVAADDGVMPQTIEAINHAKAAGVPIVVAINKIDKEGSNPEYVKQQLAEHELIPEEWNGDVIMVPVSAHKKTGIPELLENILLVAEVLELKANPDLPAHGTIIEAQLDKGRGPVATVLVERGTLHVGDTILAGTAYGKVRAMINERGEKVKKATPATPVEVLGLNDVPMAGDILDATEERIARSVAEKRIAKKKAEEVSSAKVSLDDIFSRIQEGELKELNIVVKADVQGTIQALQQSLENIKNEEVKVVVVHAGVGTINESDVMLASAANALIIGFNVRPDANARKSAEHEKVDIRTYRVIYDALNDVEAAIKGMLAPKFEESIIGHVEVRQVITISKMLIAGCYVTDGKITNSSKIRLIRDGVVIHEGELESLRRFKDDVKEVASGFECGITLENYRDVKEGDQIEAYIMKTVEA